MLTWFGEGDNPSAPGNICWEAGGIGDFLEACLQFNAASCLSQQFLCVYSLCNKQYPESLILSAG